jgi:hypothetical protein
MSYSYREAALNWLALGLLLAAWNGSDDAGVSRAVPSETRDVPERPAALRAYPKISVRAVTRMRVIDSCAGSNLAGWNSVRCFGYRLVGASGGASQF